MKGFTDGLRRSSEMAVRKELMAVVGIGDKIKLHMWMMKHGK
jgi:endonuclease III